MTNLATTELNRMILALAAEGYVVLDPDAVSDEEALDVVRRARETNAELRAEEEIPGDPPS